MRHCVLGEPVKKSPQNSILIHKGTILQDLIHSLVSAWRQFGECTHFTAIRISLATNREHGLAE